MRLPLILAILAISAPAATAGPAPAADMPVIKPGPVQSDAPECPPISRFHAVRGKQKLAPRRLVELPMADTYAAAYRRIGRCEAPIIVRYGTAEQDR